MSACNPNFPAAIPTDCIKQVLSDITSKNTNMGTVLAAQWSAGCLTALFAGQGGLPAVNTSEANQLAETHGFDDTFLDMETDEDHANVIQSVLDSGALTENQGAPEGVTTAISPALVSLLLQTLLSFVGNYLGKKS